MLRFAPQVLRLLVSVECILCLTIVLQELQFKVLNFMFCRRAWCATYGVSDRTYFRLLRRAKVDQVLVEVTRRVRNDDRTTFARWWLQDICKRFADKLPNVEEYHLPSCYFKKDMHEMYQTDSQQQSPPVQPLSLVNPLHYQPRAH